MNYKVLCVNVFYVCVASSGPNVLQKAEVRIINSTVCNDLMGGQLTSRMLCAGVLSGGVDACQVKNVTASHANTV